MATNSTPPPPTLKAENKMAPSSKTAPRVKQEPQELTNTTNYDHQQPPPPPHLIDTVAKIRDLSTALSAFHRRYDELQAHLDFIKTTIDSKLPKHLNPKPPPQNQLATIPLTETVSSNTLKPSVPESVNSEPKRNSEEKPKSEGKPNSEAKPKSEGKPNVENSSKSELELLCETMSSRGLRKYLVSQLSEVNKLREEVPKALKLASNPAKLVLECFGRFFLQGSKAYTKGSPMIPAREASVLILECFLLMGFDGVRIEQAVKEEAESAAVSWKKRLLGEGGLAKACEIDARGMLFLISCFGIPPSFKNEDLRDLIHSSNVREISGLLHRSSIFLARISEIIEGMVKSKMEIQAVDIAYTFEVENFSPQPILISFLRESKETWSRARRDAQGSFAAVNESNKSQLADLKSVIKCLEDHKIDPSKLLPGWQIKEKILSLENDIADFEKKIGEKVAPKRKADETESSKKMKTQEVKRLRFAGHVPQQQQAAGYADGKNSYDGLSQMKLLYSGHSGHTNSYSASPSVLHGSVARTLPENISSSMAGSGGGLLAAGIGASLSAGVGSVLPTGSYAGVHGGIRVDTVGQMMNHSGQPYGWHGDAAVHERLVGHTRTFPGLTSSAGFSGLYRPSPLLNGFAGLPNHPSVGVLSQTSAPDLYQFADSVLESESKHGSGSRTVGVGAVPPVVPAHHSSYLY